MKFTKDWLDIHLKTKKRESQIVDKLNNIGLEVENIQPLKNELSNDFSTVYNLHENDKNLKIIISKYNTEKDIVNWHKEAKDSLEPFSSSFYKKFSENCNTFWTFSNFSFDNLFFLFLVK